MRSFKFRLEKLLSIREEAETRAKEAYLLAHWRRLDAENDLGSIKERRLKVAATSAQQFEDRLSLEAYLHRLVDEERGVEAMIGVLGDEEASLFSEWQEAAKEAEALRKLEEKDRGEWVREANRKESAELDEWAVMRRKSA